MLDYSYGYKLQFKLQNSTYDTKDLDINIKEMCILNTEMCDI